MTEQPTPSERRQRTDAEVEEASMESFPASDPPSYTRGKKAEEGIDPALPQADPNREPDESHDDR